jgi:predicted RNA-binding Zn-ribbon protein involved in translation (DUF1610 family)
MAGRVPGRDCRCSGVTVYEPLGMTAAERIAAEPECDEHDRAFQCPACFREWWGRELVKEHQCPVCDRQIDRDQDEMRDGCRYKRPGSN